MKRVIESDVPSTEVSGWTGMAAVARRVLAPGAAWGRSSRLLVALCICSSLTMICATALSGCASDPLSPEEQYARLKEAAWQEFSSRRYAAAESRFRDAAATNFNDVEVQLGLGWSQLRQNRLVEALNAFTRIPPANAENYLHAQAGVAILYDAQGQFGPSIAAAQIVLLLEQDYVFPHDERVDWRDMSYLLAKNYLVLSAQADPDLTNALRYLGRIDPGPALLPSDSTTWTADGRRFATLAEAILKRLEQLQRSVVDAAG